MLIKSSVLLRKWSRYQQLLLWSENLSSYWFLKRSPLDQNSFIILPHLDFPFFSSDFFLRFPDFPVLKKLIFSVYWASPVQVSQLQVLFSASALEQLFFLISSPFSGQLLLPSLPLSCYKPASHWVAFFSICLLVLLKLPAVVVVTDNTTL